MGTGTRGGTDRIRAVIAVYGAGLLLGLILVSLPASSALITAAHGFTPGQYGSLFIPQLASAVIGGLGCGLLGARIGVRSLLMIALASLTGAALLLAFSALLPPASAFLVLLTAMALVGFGIGVGGGPLNAFPMLLFPSVGTAALTAVHVIVGLGMMASPLYHSAFASAGHWVAGLLGLAAFGAVLMALAATSGLPNPAANSGGEADSAGRPGTSLFLWILILAAVIYSVAEGVFTNWAIIFLQGERGLDAATASLSLTAFLGALTLGRLLASFMAVRIGALRFLVALPIAMALAFALLPLVHSPVGAIASFGFAGLACSAYFPMLIAFASSRFPASVSWIATMMISAQMVGVGLGTYILSAFVGQVSFTALYHTSILYPAAILLLLHFARRSARRAALTGAQQAQA